MSSSQSRPTLRVDWCSYEAAKYAVEHWHYSRSMPAGKMARLGAWEDGVYIGAVLFSRGASNAIGSPYGLTQTEVAELTRVALRDHRTSVSRIIAVAMRMLRRQSPGLRLIVSYADPAHGHSGGIYQAGNWLFVGDSKPDFAIVDASGKRWHSRMVSSNGVKVSFGCARKVIRPDEGTRVELPGKHKYLYPLDDAMRKQIEPLRKPYPKRADEATKDATGDQPGKGGANPTRPL